MQGTDETPHVALAGRTELMHALALALTEAGIDVVASCTDRAGVMAIVRERVADVVVVDRDLEGGGLITAAAVAARRKRPKVLVVGADAPGERRAARLAGASAYLPRTSPSSAVVALVAELVGQVQEQPKGAT